jgi:vacuolar-type H+-ATPase subunit C/Vma6
MNEKGWQYFRLCFAAIDDDVLEKKTKAVVDAFTDFWAIDNVKTIDKLLEDDENIQARINDLAMRNQVSPTFSLLPTRQG